MTPGKRCDEIIRLIDEGLALAASTAAPQARPAGREQAAGQVAERPPVLAGQRA